MKGKDSGLTVYAKDENDINGLLKRFKKRVDRSNVLNIYKEKQYYIKPSTKKHLKFHGKK